MHLRDDPAARYPSNAKYGGHRFQFQKVSSPFQGNRTHSCSSNRIFALPRRVDAAIPKQTTIETSAHPILRVQLRFESKLHSC